MELKGNRGEWSELYAFLKILTDGKIHAADVNYNKISNVFLSVLSLIREEARGDVYRYLTGEIVTIKLNGQIVGRVPSSEFKTRMDQIWTRLKSSRNGTKITVPQANDFLESVHITKLKSPATKRGDYFGGTIDIMLETRSADGVEREIGFSVKSEAGSASSLFNASADNTNFVYEVTGDMNDERMEQFNNTFTLVTQNGKIKKQFATQERMSLLKEWGCDLRFVKTARPIAMQNLISSGGMELPTIVAAMLKYFYFYNLGSHISVLDCIDLLDEEDVAHYGFPDVYDIYYNKVSQFLYHSFTGLKLGTHWNGRTEVNGGYVVVKKDGEVVAYHSTIADEFKDFLVHRLILEAPSHSRHKDMVVEKVDGKYYIKLALQLRFSLKKKQ